MNESRFFLQVSSSEKITKSTSKFNEQLEALSEKKRDSLNLHLENHNTYKNASKAEKTKIYPATEKYQLRRLLRVRKKDREEWGK